MRLKRLFGILIALGLFSQLTAQQCTISSANQPSVTKLSNGNLNFSLQAYKGLSKADQNLFFSPFSINVALAMTSSGAMGNTHKQLKDALNLNQFQTQSQIEQAFQTVINSICSNDNYSLSTANAAFIQQNFNLSGEFIKVLQQFYKSKAENVNFNTNPNQAAAYISKWVETQTNGTIKQLYPPNSIGSNTMLILVNAIYFKGRWEILFDPVTDAKQQQFSLANGQKIQTPMMRAKDFFRYHESTELKSQIVELDYSGGRLAMLIILPFEVNGLPELQRSLTAQNLQTAIDSLRKSIKIDVKMPKFQLKFREKLNDLLNELGIVDMFDRAKANLSKISDGLVVSEVVHEAFVDVDEKGTTAAAATGIGFFLKSKAPETLFNAVHPFMFIIYDKLTKLPLFIGNVNNPQKK